MTLIITLGSPFASPAPHPVLPSASDGVERRWQPEAKVSTNDCLRVHAGGVLYL